MKALAPIIAVLFLLVPAFTFAQGEYDDLYYTPSDREEARKNYNTKSVDQIVNSQKGYETSDVNDYQIITPSVSGDRINNTSQGRTVNPEYIAQYRSRADARGQNQAQNEEVYFEEGYEAAQTAEFHDESRSNQPIINNYYGNSFNNPAFYDPFYHDPYFAFNRGGMYNNWRMRRAAMLYDPFYDPFYGFSPGLSVNISFGMGAGFYGNRWSRWSYDPWMSPYYAGGFYGGGFYDPFWGPSIHSPRYYTNVNYYNTVENNNSIRRGPATSRGSVITDSRNGRISVESNGPVTRVPVKRSSFTGDRNGRVGTPSATTSGRVIDRSGAETRSPRDYSNVQERYRTRSTERSGIDRNTTFPERTRSIQRTPSRSNDRSVSPSRRDNNNRSVTPSRRDNNNRSVTPSRRDNNRSVTPSRRDNNNRSVTPSRSSGNNNRSVAPSRSGNNNRSSSSPSYRSPSSTRSSGTTGGSSYSPSRSSSSPSSGTTGRSSSSRRGGNQ